MNPITKRLSLWSIYLAVMDKNGIRPFRYSETITITNTPLIKLITINLLDASEPLHVNQIKTVDAFGLERSYKTMADFEAEFEKTFKHLRNEITRDYERLVLNSDVKVHFDAELMQHNLDLFKHLNTIEVLSPLRADLRPGATFEIECPFELTIPSDVIGVFYNKMSLREYKLELRAPLLHAEFSGRPKIVFTNKSDEIIPIGKFEPIAQIQFIKSAIIDLTATYEPHP